MTYRDEIKSCSLSVNVYDVGEHGHSADEEGDQHDDPVVDVQRRILQPNFGQDPSDWDERRTSLHQVHEAEETITESSTQVLQPITH